jgi:uncharacterized protein
MTALESAALWIALNTVFLIVISFHVGKMRIKHKVNLGDGGNSDVQCAIRAQGNYVEYAPIALIGLSALSMIGGSSVLVHILGAAFLAARIAHFLGLGLGVWSKGRLVGTLGTMLTLLATAIALLGYVLT